MLRYHIWTIGCQMNQADSEYLDSYLRGSGYQSTALAAEADLIILNSCVVRQSAESRVLNKLNSLRSLQGSRPNLAIILTGCIVDSPERELQQDFPQVDFFFKPQDWASFSQWTQRKGLPPPPEAKDLPTPASPQVSAFIPVIQGCDNFCTYCIVPYRRGRERSRPREEVLCHAERLVQQGVKEAVLLGQNVDSYGHDLSHQTDLADLLTQLNHLEGLQRIRFLTSHPKDMKQKLVQTIAHLDKVCEHLSLPVQAGDDDILKAMRRGYTVAQYRGLIHYIRRAIPGIALSTDVIVGFPGETAGQFEHTVELLQEIRFDSVHVAAYSPRPGTVASRMFPDNVPAEEKKRRREKVESVQQTIATEINARLEGQTVEVLVEDQRKGKWQGRTRTNKLVFFAHRGDLRGQLVPVIMEKTSPWALQGRAEESIPSPLEGEGEDEGDATPSP